MHSLFLPAQGLAALCATAALAAGAQPALSFQSALDGYQSAADEKLTPWPTANETVYRRGGWKAYAQEAGPADTERKNESASGSPAIGTGNGLNTATPHAGHGMAQPVPDRAAPQVGQPAALPTPQIAPSAKEKP